MDAKGWANLLRTEGDCEHERKMFINIADAIDALLAENAQLKQTIETMKANEREKYASAAKALGVVAPCDRAAILNEKGE